MKDYPLIKGLTPSGEVSRYLRNIPYSKIDESNILKLSYIPYEISRILSINIGVTIKVFKKIKQKKGCRVNIVGFRNIEINYMSEASSEKTHQLNYKIPFSTEIAYRHDDINVKNVYAPVDKLDFKVVNPKELLVATRIYIAPLI